MLPPLHLHSGTSQKPTQPPTQPWPASTSGSGKPAAGSAPGFGPLGASRAAGGSGAADAGTGGGVGVSNNITAANGGRALPGSSQAASQPRRGGSAGSNHGSGTPPDLKPSGTQQLMPFPPPYQQQQSQSLPQNALSPSSLSIPQPPLSELEQYHQLLLQQQPINGYQDPEEADQEGAEGEDAAGQLDDEAAQLALEHQQAQEQLQQLQQLQNPLLHSNNPYLQILAQAGVGIGGGGPGNLAAAAQAAHKVQQAALRKRVQRDIKRMLARNRAYQQQVKGPPAISAEALAQLAQPKQRPGSRPDPQVVANLPDPVEWARWKTDQLVISRMAEERRQAEWAEEKKKSEEQLAAFRQQKMEAKHAQAEAKARQTAAEAAYRANMSAYLNHKGALDLEDFVKRKEEQRERLSLMRSRQVKTLSGHHY
ncbi:hypothetical protein VOLCADRAFT_107030 [Volvox carteri f. nagariensis]|uniref:Uncharacterized protein n=1 Tax=Volvox carteri f. nagariensis TaxID=3068 RepID=D8UBE8_VOLCA|nr:uncharacterized protein VOLCADRAFT_107030 [Volvox carteri f. nagariensis]EFJ42935.1 hypothetical protein VOLCADRAFT_107030 [Volvox carteri f. nagariensis]|eukprot:XP_002955975.1 hypothetical protein VOLCADRAFT_107030 [Volvox carteri f. nagariensis]